jgi:hypothetical protein
LALAGAMGTLTGSPPAAWTDDTLTGSTAGAFSAYYGKDFGAGTPKTVSKFVVYGSTTRGTNTNGGTGTVYLEGSNDNASWAALGNSGAVASVGAANWVATVTVAAPASYRYYRWYVTDSAGDDSCYLAETVYYAGVNNMTVISASVTASAVPTRADLAFQIKSIDAITINTDVLGYVSRDGGTTWTLATLALEQSLEDGTSIYSATGIDISAQPSGSALRTKLVSANAKNFEYSGYIGRCN